MKMVSAAKYARAERDLKAARPFGAGAGLFNEKLELKDDTPGTLMIALTSDRGLCGGVHSSVSKRIKAYIAEESDKSKIKIITIGDKAKAMLAK